MISDELRQLIPINGIVYIYPEDLETIADRIDAQHRAALEKVAAMVDACPLEARVAAMERKLNHKGGVE